MTHVSRMPVFRAAGSPSESWTSYAERLEFLYKGNGITDNDKKHALLVPSFDASMFQLVKSLVQPKEIHEKTYKEIVDILKSHFNPAPSAIICRYRFNSRDRKQHETIAAYVAELRGLAQHCQFGAKLDEMIRDRLVCGINDSRIQRRLLQEPDDLTYEGAFKLAVTMETASKDIRDLHKNSADPAGTTHLTVQQVKHQQRSRKTTSIVCTRCHGSHLATDCRFREAICRKCGKKGHIAKACRSTKSSSADQSKPQRQPATNQVTLTPPETVSTEDESYELYNIPGPIVITVKVNSQPILMEVDTGAALSIMSKATFQRHFPSYELKPSTLSLHTYTGQALSVLGMIDAEVEYESQSLTLPLVIVDGNGPTLFERSWLDKIRLDWNRICNLHEKPSLSRVLESHADLFRDRLRRLQSSTACHTQRHTQVL